MSELGEDQALAHARLRLVDVMVRFGGILAVGGVSLEAQPAEVLAIIGPNGAGKTTLFDVVAGVRPPNRGRIELDGVDVTDASPSARARLGMRRTFQRVQTFGWLSVEDNILAALEWRGGGGGFLGDVAGWPARRRRERSRRDRVADVIEHCGLGAVRHELAGSLPIGTARMVELGRAIADEPSILLLDEPASGLDRAELTRLGEQIQRVRAETGCTVLLIEHNAQFVMSQCDRIVVLDQGQVLAVGSPDAIQADPLVREAYLGEVA